MYIGDIVKNFRATHKLTQSQFIARCGITSGMQANISRIENGKSTNSKQTFAPTPRVSTLRAIAKGMGISLPQLMQMMEEE